jgi:hypothetical protein
MRHADGISVSAFYEVDSFSFTRQLTDKIKQQIEGLSKEYILGVDEHEFKTYLVNNYSLEPLVVDLENPIVEEPKISKEWIENIPYRGKYQTDVYEFTVKYNFTGSAVIFKIRPDSWTMTTTQIYISEALKTVSFSFKLYKKDPNEFIRAKNDHSKSAFINLSNANVVVKNWNLGLTGLVDTLFQNQKLKFKQENDFFAAINIKVNKDTASVFSAPTIKKIIIPKPTIPKNKELASDPILSKEIYDDILKVIYDSGKSMEKKPALYTGKDEEGLRDQFLFVLETRYEGTTATGETFNRSGKTDIILKFAQDSSNLFVAECKFWHGPVEYLKAISQLFDRYLTWRDSKVALIIFIKNKDFTNVLNLITTEIKNHPYYIKENGKRGETSFSYIFHLQQDNDKRVFLEVLAFHYDK